MPTMLYPNAGALEVAGVMQTALAASEIHLFQAGSVTLGPATTLAELVAAEADYTGYALEAVAAWLNPLINPLGGASIESGMVQFEVTGPVLSTNVIQGWWIENAAGDLICAGDFPAPIPLNVVGDGIPMNVQLVFGG